MTAWADMQQEWAKQCADKMKTGTLLWDQSAAFDMLDADIFCQKIDIYNV